MYKRALRRTLFERIRKLAEDEKAGGSRRIRDALSAHPAVAADSLILAYLPLPSEPDLVPLIFPTSARKPGPSWGFPRVGSDGLLSFLVVGGPEDCATGDFGILEPIPERCRPADEERVSLVLVPGVGFDPASGMRLGPGKGGYDRFLARLRALAEPPEIVGVAFACQLEPLAGEDHDVPMDAVITEEGWRRPCALP